MKQFYLAEIITKDKLVHQGIYYKPKKPGRRAILWVHGLTSTFYNNIKLFESIAGASEKSGIGFAAFNNRGHDIVTGIRKIDPKEPKGYTKVSGGAGHERFEDCIFDIDAGISFLVTQGYSEIILAGHSTGANKVCYYAGMKKDNRIVGIILLSPGSDRLSPSFDKEYIATQLISMNKKVRDGKGDELTLVANVYPATPMRFISTFSKNSAEDVFDYGDVVPKLRCFSAIIKSLLVVIGSKDEYLDRPAEKVLDVFARYTRSQNYHSVIIPNALHGFNGKEQMVVSAIFRWIENL